MKKLIGALILTLAFVTNVPAQTGQVTFEWTEPDTGAPAHYIAVALTDTLDLSSIVDTQVALTNQATFEIPNDTTVFISVYAVDERGQAGPRSVWSEPYLFVTPPPSSCGQPFYIGRQ